jgi:hypothetical protein
MNLKESFRYQNFLETKLSGVVNFLTNSSNITTKKETHNRKKSNPDADDETLENVTERSIKLQVNDLMDFVVHVMIEKEKLADAITTAKSACGIDIDSAVSLNKKRQALVTTFTYMGNIKPLERNTTGRGYKFNNEGNQTTYVYDIKEVTTIDFDRNKVKAIAKQLITTSDEVSNKLDKIMIDTEVNYVPIYDVNDTLEDVLDQFMTEKAPQ